MREIKKVFSHGELSLLRALVGGTWLHYAIPLRDAQPDYALVDIVLRTSDAAIALHVEDEGDESGGFSFVSIDKDIGSELTARRLGGVFSHFKTQTIRQISILRLNINFESRSEDSFALTQDVGILFEFETGVLSVMKNPYFDMDFKISQAPTFDRLELPPWGPIRVPKLGEHFEVAVDRISI